MNIIRYVASLLLLTTGVIHLLHLLNKPLTQDDMTMVVFGAIYFAVGVILFYKLKLGAVLGIIFPLTGLSLCIFIVKYANWGTEIKSLAVIDLAVIVACIIMLWRSKK